MNIRITVFASLLTVCLTVKSQTTSLSMTDILHLHDKSWFASKEATSVADSIVKYQFASGGWAKNHNWHLAEKGAKLKERTEIWRQKNSSDGIGSTIDNKATTTEIKILARVYKATGNKKYRKAVLKGLDYLVKAQYPHGGWPQYYPYKPFTKEGAPFYSNHITFNDNAIYNVMCLLRDVYEERKPYDALQLPSNTLQQLRAAFDRGISCILKCQIIKDGRRTVWCQQHDERTFMPANARSYELASFTGSHETPDLLKLLMSLDKPSDEVVEAVTAAVEWLKAHAIEDMDLETFTNKEGKKDRRLVHRFGSRIWARYYDQQTEEPFVCDRDGVPQPSLEYIGYERRNGYGWYNKQPQEVIDMYPAWISKVRP